MQDADRLRITEAELQIVTKRKPTAEETRALLFAWRVCKHVKSNAIVYARFSEGHGQTVGVGAGQMSRVDAARFGAMKAILPLKGTVAASDAFFPFPDGLETIAQAGATAVIQPGGSVRDAEVIEAADRLGRGDGVYRRQALPARINAAFLQEMTDIITSKLCKRPVCAACIQSRWWHRLTVVWLWYTVFGFHSVGTGNYIS